MQEGFSKDVIFLDEYIVSQTRETLELTGHEVESIALIPEGRAHYIFRIVDRAGLISIARFEKSGRGVGLDGIRRDFEFNGPISISRERNLIDLVREQANLPALRVYGMYEDTPTPFLIVENLPGIYWSEYIEKNNFSKEAYLNSLKFIGFDMANAHKVKFISFGDIIREDIIQPGNITSFAERIRIITEPKIKRAEQLGTLNSNELAYLKHTLQSELSDLEDVTKTSSLQPILAITDIHPKNFLVDDNGKPSGYFDLEYCQSAPPALDFYFLRWFLLNYFEGISDQAEEALLERYTANGGTYDSKNPTNKKWNISYQ